MVFQRIADEALFDEEETRVPGAGTFKRVSDESLFAPTVEEIKEKEGELGDLPGFRETFDQIEDKSQFTIDQNTGRVQIMADKFALSDVPEAALGAAEMVVTLATDFFGAGVGAVGGTGASIAAALDNDDSTRASEAFVEVMNETRDFTRVDPKTSSGMATMQMLGDGFEMLIVEPAEKLGDVAFEATDSPLAATIARMAPETALFAGMFKALRNKSVDRKAARDMGKTVVENKRATGGRVFTVDEMTANLERQVGRFHELAAKNKQELSAFERIELQGLQRQIRETGQALAEATGLDAPVMRNAKGLFKQTKNKQNQQVDYQKVQDIIRDAAHGKRPAGNIEIVIDGVNTVVTQGLEELIAAIHVGERNVPVRMIRTRVDPATIRRQGGKVQDWNVKQVRESAAMKDRAKLTVTEAIRTAYDISAPLKSRIAKLLPEKFVSPVLEQYQLMQNSGTSAMTFAKEHFEPIFSQINGRQLTTRRVKIRDKKGKVTGEEVVPITDEMVLDEIVHSRVMTEVTRPNRHPKYKTSGGLTGEQHAANLQLLRQQIGETEFGRINALADELFSVYKGLLRLRLDEGVITKKTYEKLKNFDYQPTQHLQLHDPWVIEAGDKSVRSSGVLRLKDGNINPVETSARELLHDTIHRTHSIVARNRFFNEFFKGVEAAPKESMIHQYVRTLKPDQKPPPGHAVFEYIKDGKQQRVAVDPFIGKVWQAPGEVELLRTKFGALRWLTGVTPTRAIAVGVNFTFPIVDTPRAMVGVAFSNNLSLTGVPVFGSGIRNPALRTAANTVYGLPLSVAQIVRNMAKVNHDVRRKAGIFETIAKEGGYPRFLAEQGLQEFRAITRERVAPRNQVAASTVKWLDDAATTLSSFGVHMEALLRTAVAEQALARGLSKREAAFEALRVVNYNEAGTLTAALDNIIPFFNAATQVGRAQFRSFKESPAHFANSSAVGASAFSMGLTNYMMNWMINDECTMQITDHDLATGFNICLPKSHGMEDPDGNILFPYLHIPADGAAVPFIAASAWISRRFNEDRTPSNMMLDALAASVLPLPDLTNVPLVDAGLALFGEFDTFRKTEIYPRESGRPYNEYYGEHERNRTPMYYVEAGRWLWEHGLADVGLEELTSPERLRGVVDAYIPQHPISNFWRALNMEANPSVRELYQSNWETWDVAPGIGRLLRIPRGTNYFADMEEASGDIQASQSARRRETDLMAFQVVHNQLEFGTAVQKIAAMRDVSPVFQENLLSRLEIDVHGKRIYKNLPRDTRVGVPPWAIWRSIASTADHKERARKYFEVWRNLSTQGRKNSSIILNRLTAVGKNYKIRTPAFEVELRALKDKHGTEHEPSALLTHDKVAPIPEDDESRK